MYMANPENIILITAPVLNFDPGYASVKVLVEWCVSGKIAYIRVFAKTLTWYVSRTS